MPVDTVWIGTSSRRSSERRFVKRAMSSRRWIWPNSGSRWRMVPKLGPSSHANSTGILPTRRSSSTQEAPVPPRITLAVPKVGWPANGSSSATVKMRTFTPCSRSMAASRGRMKVVSERLVSRARRWNSSSRSARASVNTATAFPSRARSVKTSTTVYAKLRIRQPGLFTGATRTTGAGGGGGGGALRRGGARASVAPPGGAGARGGGATHRDSPPPPAGGPPPASPSRTSCTSLLRPGEGGDLDAGIVVAGALRDVRVVGGGERAHRLAVVARAHPRALERGDHAGPHGVGDHEGKVHLTEIVPHAHPLAVGEPADPRIVRVHFERRRGVARR